MGPGNDDDVSVPDLSLLFSTNATDLQAVKVFVDRVPEQQAFDRAVHAHWASTARSDYDSHDVLSPRRNVLVYYGVGGVGKTSLAQQLERRHGGEHGNTVTEWAPWERRFRTSVTARADLASEAGADLEQVLLGIRLAVGALGRPMHAFDLALSRYWEHAHPTESIADYLRRDGRLSRIAERVGLPEQISEGLKDVAQAVAGSGALASVATRLAVLVTDGMRARAARRHAIQGCSRLTSLLRAEPNVETLSYFPHLLSWDLAEHARLSGPDFHVAVFLDTFEDVAHGEQRRLERLLNRLIWLMPNVLFVISTRNRLDWAEEATSGQLDRTGPVAWPGLVRGSAEEPAQHLVGYLSTDDAARFLRERLRRDGNPVIPAELRERIAQDSDGYPLYLDLAVTRYLQLAAAEAEPRADDFAGGFPGLVDRILRDLTADERRLMRILSLLDSFDVALATAIVDLPSEKIAAGLVRRAFVEVNETAPFRYSIHRLLRAQVRDSDSGTDAFTEADWHRYAARAFTEFGERFVACRADGDRATIISLLNQALRLADEFGFPVSWTVDAAYLFIADSLWESTLRPRVRVPVSTPAAALAQTLQTITNRQVVGRRESAEVLLGVLATGLLDGDGKDLATYYAAEALRESGRVEQAEELLTALTTRESRIADLAIKGMVHQLRRRGRFADALALIRSRRPSGMWTQMEGTLYWSQGMLDEARNAYRKARALSLADGRVGHAAEVSGCLAFVCGLSAADPGDAGAVAEGRDALEHSRHRWGRLMARLGDVMLNADGTDETADRFSEIAAEGFTAGLTSIQAYATFGRCLNAAVAGDTERLAAERDGLAALPLGGFGWLVEVVGFWLGEPPAEQSDWIGGAGAARERWRQIVARRLGGPGGA